MFSLSLILFTTIHQMSPFLWLMSLHVGVNLHLLKIVMLVIADDTHWGPWAGWTSTWGHCEQSAGMQLLVKKWYTIRKSHSLRDPFCFYSFKTLIHMPKLCTFSNYLLGTNMLLITLIWIVISAEPAWGQWPAWRSSCNTWQSEGTYF